MGSSVPVTGIQMEADWFAFFCFFFLSVTDRRGGVCVHDRLERLEKICEDVLCGRLVRHRIYMRHVFKRWSQRGEAGLCVRVTES